MLVPSLVLHYFPQFFKEKRNCLQSVVLLTGTLECSSFLCSNFSQWGVAKNHYRYLILIPHQADLHSHTSWPALEVLTVHAEEKTFQHKTLSDTCSTAYIKHGHAYENFVKDIQPLKKCTGPQQHSWPWNSLEEPAATGWSLTLSLHGIKKKLMLIKNNLHVNTLELSSLKIIMWTSKKVVDYI